MSLPTSLAAFKAAHSNMSSNPVASTTSPSTSGNYGETFLATIGTDVVPVPIQTITSINAAAYLKNVSFQSLSQAAYSLLSTYGVNNVCGATTTFQSFYGFDGSCQRTLLHPLALVRYG